MLDSLAGSGNRVTDETGVGDAGVTEMQTIANKVDKLFGVTSDLARTTAIIATEFKAHREADETAVRFHAASCPAIAQIASLKSEVVRLDTAQIGHGLGIAHNTAKLEEITSAKNVEVATDELRMTPIKWAAAHADRIITAILVAYALSMSIGRK